ncbi:MAG: PBP1A family penicillin-binding protein [Deltaproteobacteria bacterium]|nr:PBP1A family penicillin-binding protein [Deltaproteobacteria bacterium]
MRIIKKNRQLIINLFIAAAVILLLALLGLAAYGWSLSGDIERRFSGRRWSIPSRIYSDSTILYPGQEINTELFFDKLKNLGYREVDHAPEHKGEVKRKGDLLDLFLNDLNLPAQKRTGFPVKIVISQGIIMDIVHSQTLESIPVLELEPEELGLFFGKEREQRRLISLDEVPDTVRKAFLAAEDSRFYQHHGLDFRGIFRAFYTNLRKKGVYQGGSTITQQLAKNYFLTPEKTLSRKLKEIFLAVVMEINYGKDEIFEIYLNEIYFGQKGSVAINGLGEASYFYFGKPVKELSLEEGAALAGLIRAPNLYSPYINPDRCKARRDQVLNNMARHVWITQADCEAALLSPLNPTGYQGYGRKAPYFLDYLSGQLEALYSKDDLTRLGLSVFTTLDTQAQKAAETALSKGLARIEGENPSLMRNDPLKQLQGAIIVIQPKTGYIIAMAGGRDYGVSQFNRITQARRQPGSAFKPFVYLCGLDHFTPASMLSNIPVTYNVDGEEWAPENYSPVPEEQMRMRTALARSINIPTVDLAMKMGMDAVVRTASAFHFTTPLKPHPSLALGSMEVIPLELARAYCAFAADGLLPMPLSLKSVSDEKGIILNSRHMEVQKAVTPAKAYIMNSLLNSVVEEGTAASLKTLGITNPVAAKTGTTNDSRDAWFVGYTPEILAMVWIGFDDGTSMQGTGTSAALPIWADLMKELPQYMSGGWFQRPKGVVDMVICAESGELAIPDRCPETIREVFLEELVPTETCSIHSVQNPIIKFFRELKDLVNEN